MNFSIFFLLIICLSIRIGETSPLPDKNELEGIAAANQSITGKRSSINLKLSKGGRIYALTNLDEVFWKGTFNETIDVAIKIVSDEEIMRKEKNIFEVLKATENFDIEKRRIPRLYYHGPCLGGYFAIATTLFEGTLQERIEDKIISESTALLIFKQVVESLSYIHSKNVAHNRISGLSILFRGKDVFVGNFENSVLGGTFMDDYNVLMVLFWEMVNINLITSDHDKTEFLQNNIIEKAMNAILNTNVIRGKLGKVPNYKKIIEIADKALAEIGGPVQFDWLKEGEHGSSSGH